MLTAFILVKSSRHGLTSLGPQLADVEGVAEVYTVTGEWDFVAIVRVREHEDLANVGTQHLTQLDSIQKAQTMWAVDPLDGTTNFMRGFPSVGISVALLDGGQPLVGVVLAPYLEVEFTASQGNGAFLNDERLPQHRGIDPSGAVVATGFPFRNKSLLPRYLSMFELAIERFEDLRRAGAAALDLAWTASSTFDGFFELSLNTWDVAAGALLVLEVGGRVTDWSGGDTWLESGNILAAAPAVHDVLLELAAKSHER